MTTSLIVNLQGSSNGDGSSLSPYTYSQFLQSISGAVPTGQSYADIGDRNYYLSGSKVIALADGATWAFDGLVNDTINIHSLSGSDGPIKVTFTAGVHFIMNDRVGSLIPGTSLYFGNIKQVILNNVMLQSQNAEFHIIGNNKTFLFKNCWVTTTTNDIRCETGLSSKLLFINSNIKANYILLGNVYLSAINSIIDIKDISTTLTADNILFDNCVLTSAVTNYTAADNIISTNIQESWVGSEFLNSAVSAISQDNLNYLSADWNSISASVGNKLYTDLFWGMSARDGVGSLYFPYVQLAFSANGDVSATSTVLLYEVIFEWNDAYSEYGVSVINLNFDDYILSSVNYTSSTSASYTYIYNITSATPVLFANSKNGWYSVTSAIDLTLNLAIAPTAVFNIWDSTSASISAAKTDESILFYPSSLNKVYKYKFVLDNGIETIAVESISAMTDTSATPISYPLANYYYPELVLNTAYSQSEGLLIYRTLSAYYVDLDSNYVDEGDGTDTSAFNYNQFRDRVIENGTGVYKDVYYLKNLRQIDISASSEAFIVDKNKNFIFDAWDTSAYGPWVFVLNGNYSWAANNIIASFAGVTLKNGIVYNKPYRNETLQYIGSKVAFSHLYDVYVVLNGDSSKYIIDPYNYMVSASATSNEVTDYFVEGAYTSATSNIYGSTIYVPNTSAVIDNTDVSAYDFNLVNTVLANFISSADQLSACQANIYNCVFNVNGVSASYVVVVDFASQYDWIPPTDANFPFNRNNVFYDKAMSYIFNNRKLLKPFDGITTPPNPGKYYPVYDNHPTGLFGYLRKDYLRE